MNKRLTKIQKLVAARRAKVATKPISAKSPVATHEVENLPASNTAEVESVEAPVNETPVELTPTVEESKVEDTPVVDAPIAEEPVVDNQISEESNETTPEAPVVDEPTEAVIDDGFSKKGKKGKKRKNTEE
jgi:hypothetical protein